MCDLSEYKNSNYIDEIYEYSVNSFEFVGNNKGRYGLGIIISVVLMIINLPFKIKIDCAVDKIGISRNPLHTKILTKALGSMYILNDDIKNSDFSIYRIGSRIDRIKYILLSFLGECKDSKNEVLEILSRIETLDVGKKKQLSRFFDKRIAHTCYFSWAVDTFLEQSKIKTVCVSYTHDRFALASEQICKKRNIELICVPHGEIENRTLPRRYPGDKVYLLNAKIAKLFNDSYNTDAYIYDLDILERIYKVDGCDIAGRKVVYMITPYFFVDEQLSCINILSEYLAARSVKLYVKQHPTCTYDMKHYKNVEELKTLEEAICNNFCIGFFTTALIESVFNNSKAVSILKMIDEKALYIKHKDIFEGCGVHCVESESELFEKLDGYLKGLDT